MYGQSYFELQRVNDMQLWFYNYSIKLTLACIIILFPIVQHFPVFGLENASLATLVYSMTLQWWLHVNRGQTLSRLVTNWSRDVGDYVEAQKVVLTGQNVANLEKLRQSFNTKLECKFSIKCFSIHTYLIFIVFLAFSEFSKLYIHDNLIFLLMIPTFKSQIIMK